MNKLILIARLIFILISLFWLVFGIGCLVYIGEASPALSYGIWFMATACVGVIASWKYKQKS